RGGTEGHQSGEGGRRTGRLRVREQVGQPTHPWVAQAAQQRAQGVDEQEATESLHRSGHHVEPSRRGEGGDCGADRRGGGGDRHRDSSVGTAWATPARRAAASAGSPGTTAGSPPATTT